MAFQRDLLGSVTIWYNPEGHFIDHILTYAAYPALLVIVDNSALNNQALFDKIPHANKLYLWNGENAGIAKALNQGLAAIIEKGLKFALTLDQDSSFQQAEIEKLLQAAEKLDWYDIGILSPIHLQQKSIPAYNAGEFTPVTTAMTSGNILNLEIAVKAGLFNEQLFIDHVDNEYCLRLNKAGFKVLQANAFLIHELGKYQDTYILGKRVGGFISHSPERLYYFVRNSSYILRKYFFVDIRYSMMEVTSLAKRSFKLFLEEDTKKRLSMYFKGLRDSHKLK